MVALLTGCGTLKPTPSTDTKVEVVVRDSLVVHRDTVVIQIPVESSSTSKVQYSHLETTVAWSDAAVDSVGLLTHNLVNKPVEVKHEIVYVDRVKTEYRDSVQVKEIPVRVEVIRKEVPRWCWYLLVIDILLVIGFAVKVYLKLKP